VHEINMGCKFHIWRPWELGYKKYLHGDLLDLPKLLLVFWSWC